jgi:hypothetical protein
MQFVRKKVRGKWIKAIESASPKDGGQEIDDHRHETVYARSEKIQLRKVNPHALASR